MDRSGRGSAACVVIPCFNEAGRLALDELVRLTGDGRCSVIAVDDGSIDATPAMLAELARQHPTISVLTLRPNRGKGEAVRAGLVQACTRDIRWVGYLDADLSTPVDEFHRLLDVAESRPGAHVVTAARVALLGRDIRRSPFRHYTGRAFATIASAVLHKPVYDTQCGAKLFRNTPALARSVASPFRSRWAFDVELLGRLHRAGVPPEAFWEEPLLQWHDAGGSRRTVAASVRSAMELGLIAWDLRVPGRR